MTTKSRIKRDETQGLIGIFLILVIAACLSGLAKGQEPPKPAPAATPAKAEPQKASAYQLSAAQLEKLDILQLRLKRAFDVANKANADLADECKAIVAANKWPADTAWRLSDPKDILSQLVFEAPKAAEVKPEAKK